MLEYRVHYHAALQGMPSNLKLVVLMDGTAIEPKVTGTRR